MTTIWFDHFKQQIPKLTGHTLSLIEELSFVREDNVIIQGLVCFTKIFVQEMRKRFAQKHQDGVNRKFTKFLRVIKNNIADNFRNALIPSISHNRVHFSLSRFAVLLNTNIKQCQNSSHYKLLPNYRIIHAFKLEEAKNGLTIVFAGFVFDCNPPNDTDWAFFDLKISNFEEISIKFVSNGIVYTDLLELDSLEIFNPFSMSDFTYAETYT
ncbi:MAG: hypothetical protein ACE5R6_10775 [Candidatus Heimdallarchaeota archaeon]